MRVEVGSKVSEMSSKELKRDLLLYAKRNPVLFLELVSDENVYLRNVGIKAVEAGIIKLSPDQRTFMWASNDRKLMTVPFDEHPYSALAAWFKTDDTSVVSSYAPAATTTSVPSKFLPNYIYKVHRIEYKNNNCEIVNTSDFNDFNHGSFLFRPTATRPIANIRNNILRVSIGSSNNDADLNAITFVIPTRIIYFIKPLKPRFGYVVVNGEALYNPQNSTNFQLHPSEEELVVFKILELAGVTIAKPDLVNIASQEQAEIKTQQKS